MTDKELMKLFKSKTNCRFIGKFDNTNGGYIKVKVWEVITTTNGYQRLHICNTFAKREAENLRVDLELYHSERGCKKFAVVIEKGQHFISKEYMNEFLGIEK